MEIISSVCPVESMTTVPYQFMYWLLPGPWLLIMDLVGPIVPWVLIGCFPMTPTLIGVHNEVPLLVTPPAYIIAGRLLPLNLDPSTFGEIDTKLGILNIFSTPTCLGIEIYLLVTRSNSHCPKLFQQIFNEYLLCARHTLSPRVNIKRIKCRPCILASDPFSFSFLFHVYCHSYSGFSRAACLPWETDISYWRVYLQTLIGKGCWHWISLKRLFIT